VKKTRKEEVPLMSIERNPLFLIISLLLTVGMAYLTFQNLFAKEVLDINPLSFFLFVPTLVIFFQTMWYLLNPFAYIYEDKFEIKRSMFHNQFWHFVDIKKVGEIKNGKFNIQYNDDEVEPLKLFGVRRSDLPKFREEIIKKVEKSLTERP
jgi:hypothetical protein